MDSGSGNVGTVVAVVFYSAQTKPGLEQGFVGYVWGGPDRRIKHSTPRES